jgi:ABC-type multidrug transport system permease subunit
VCTVLCNQCATTTTTTEVTAETLVQLPLPLIFSCIVYYLIGLQRTPEKFLIFWAIMTLTSLAATSLALMISAFCRTTDLSVTVLPMALEVSRLFGGFFLRYAAVYLQSKLLQLAYASLSQVFQCCNSWVYAPP